MAFEDNLQWLLSEAKTPYRVIINLTEIYPMTTPDRTFSPGSRGLRNRENLCQLPLVWCLTFVEKRLVEEVKSNDILIIVGETGSGKTTH
ncbi:unnamed protein product [Camellia sinensis]